MTINMIRRRVTKITGNTLEKLLKEAVSRASYPRRDVVVTLQADFTEEPLAIPTMVKRVEGGADLVVAAQPPNGRSAPRAVRWVRRGLPVTVHMVS